jgi:NADH-quinone oxidoreductase subunit J
MKEIVFFVASSISVISSVLVVTRKNPVYSVLYLIACFASLAVVFLLLFAPFIAAMQMMIYVGAIIVMFIFVIMLLRLERVDLLKELSTSSRILAGIPSCALLGTLSLLIVKESPGAFIKPQEGFGSAKLLGKMIFTKFLVPFELLSILVIIAIIAAILLAKRGK